MPELVTHPLERELYEVKTYASELSGVNERNKKEIGNLRKAAAAAAELDLVNADLKIALVQAQAQIKALEAGLVKANEQAAAGAKAVAAGKAISEALGQLSAS